MDERKGTLVDDLNDLEGFCASMKPGNVVVITGEAHSGKTKLAMGVAHVFAPDAEPEGASPKYAYVLSPEKTSQTTVDAGLCKRHILVDDCPRLFLDGIISRARAVARAYRLSLVVIDDFQSVARRFLEDPSQNRREISEAIKALANELQIPVVLVVSDAHKVPCAYCQCNLQFLDELADYTDVCVCLARSECGKPTYCMMRA